MKVFIATFIVLIMAGCSPEDISGDSTETALAAIEHINKKAGSPVPANPDNAFDAVGTISYQLLEEYYETHTGVPNLQQVISEVESLAFQHTGFLALTDLSNYVSIVPADVNPYLHIEGQDIRQHLSPAYSATAKAIYTTLNDQLAALKSADATYQEAYQAIVQIEEDIIADNSITVEEREAILLTTSILRHAYYHDGKKRRRDRDWEWMTGHVVATANAAMESKPKAIIVSLATDIYQM